MQNNEKNEIRKIERRKENGFDYLFCVRIGSFDIENSLKGGFC